MNLDELKKNVSIIDLAANYNLKREGKTYRINPCPKCGHADHFTIFPETNSYSSFSDCCKGGSVIDFLIEVEGMSWEGAMKELNSRVGEEYNEKEHKKSAKLLDDRQGTTNKNIDLTKQIIQWHEDTYKDGDCKKNLLNLIQTRFIRPDLITEHKISVVKGSDGYRAIFPVWHKGEVVSYTARALDGQEPKYKKPSGVSASEFYFNMDLLNKPNDKPIILTEGAIDALSLEALGFQSIGLDSVKNIKTFMEKVKENPKAREKEFLIAFDNDAAGREAVENSPYQTIKIPKEYKDINEWYIDSRKNVQEANTEALSIEIDIINQVELSKQPDSVANYLTHGFMKDIEQLSSYRQIKSGFSNLDNEMTGLFPGLYVVGGISSVGKTTFVHQLTDQVAEQGEHVIYFSLEQSRLEMVSKSLARETAKNDLNGAITSFSIRQGKTSLELEKAVRTYSSTSQRVNIVEGNFNTTVDSMREYIDSYIKRNNVKPFVVVDYLQIIPGDVRMNDKQRTDYNVTELKRMSRDLNIVVIAISSINRGNYLAPIDFESFKESGNIEFTADVVWGLQLEVIRSDLFNKEGKLKEKREKVAEAKAEPQRQIELVCLKNRNGTPSFSCSFTYYARHDFYEPNEKESNEHKHTQRKDRTRM